MALNHFAACFSENCLSFCSCFYFTFETSLHSPSDEVKDAEDVVYETRNNCKDLFAMT